MDKFILKTRCRCMHYSTNTYPDDFVQGRVYFSFYCSHCGRPLTLTIKEMERIKKEMGGGEVESKDR